MSRFIERIVIENFKSYGGKHIIGPFKTFTAIIGPNGAGKSNVMDAISFVLGVKTNQLRGSKLQDLIHRKEDEKEATRTAYVELVFQDAKELIHFRRTITQTTSSYHLNGKVVKWDEYNEKLKAIGVLVKARNFLVFQGDVESIAQKTPKQLTELFEQISGSAELKAEYDELKEKQQQAEEVYLRCFEKKRGIQKEKKQLEQQKEEAEKFTELQAEKQALKQRFFLWQLYHAEKELAANTKQLETLQKEIEEKKKELKTIDKEVKDKGAAYAEARRKIAGAEKKIQNANTEIEKKRPLQIKMTEEINFLRKSIEKLKKSLEKSEGEYKKQQDEIQSLEKEIKKLQAESEKVQESLDHDGEIKLAKEQLAEYHKLKQQAGAKFSAARQEVETLKRATRLLKEAYARQESSEKFLSSRQDQLNEDIQKLTARKQRMEKHIAEIREEKERLEKETGVDRKKKERLTAQREEITKTLEEMQSKLSDAKSDRRQSEKETRMASCLESLKTHWPGKIRGRLFDLCKAQQQKYHLAITIAMGKNAEGIVVEDTETAIQCIQYMKENRVGTATFLPLNSIKTKPVNESFRSLGGTFKLVYDVVSCDEHVKKALLYALGNTLLCESIDEARQLCFARGNEGKYKVVVTDGTVIHKSGNLTGGVGKAHLQAKKWNDAEMQKLTEQRDKLVQELAEIDREIRVGLGGDGLGEKTNRINTLTTQLQYSEVDLKETNRKLESTKLELKNLESEIASKKPEAKRTKNVLDEKEAKIAELEKKILHDEQKLFADFSKKVGVDNIREWEEKRLAQSQALLDKKLVLDNQIARLKSKLEYEKKRNLDRNYKDTTKEIETKEKKLNAVLKDEKTFLALMETKKKQVDKQTEDIKKQQKELDEKHEEYKQIKKKAAVLQKALATIDKQVTTKEATVEQSKHLRSQILKRSKLEQVEIPLRKKGKKKRKKRKGSEEEEEEEKEEKEAKGKEGEEVDIDYDTLEDKDKKEIKSAAAYEKVKNEFEQAINDVNSKLEKLAPNLKAIDHFNEVSDRMANTKEEWDKKKKASAEAAEAFQKKALERLERFKKAYDHVSKAIDPIYRGLTLSVTFPMGGKAYLHLEDNEEPYLAGVKYTAMPPMKRFRDMSELSGGEQTIAALALLFAIHSYHPAPFFVLDEVDAALDNANVGKVSQYIKQRSQADKLQCIVISLKDTFYTKADGLVGVYRDRERQQSGTLTLDLTKFDTA